MSNRIGFYFFWGQFFKLCQGIWHIYNRKGCREVISLFYKSSLEEIFHFLKGSDLYGKPPTLLNDFLPKISIIVPNFNHAKFLAMRLDSIYAQTYSNYEVVLLDDCSSDNSLDILKNYAAKYPNITRCYFNKKNSGTVFNQWKYGLELATGDLIWIAESDDYCLPDFLEKLVGNFQNTAIMLAFCKTEFVKGAPPQTIWTSQAYLADLNLKYWDRSWIKSSHNLVNDAWAIKNIIPNVSSAIFRHPGRISLLNDPIWQQLKLCGDWMFYLTIIRGGLVAYSPHTTNFYRQHDKNTSTHTQTKDCYYQEHEVIAKTILNLYKINPNVIKKQAFYLYQHWCQFRKNESKDQFEVLYNINRINTTYLPRKHNILMCVYSLIAGGGETFPIFLANLLYENGYGVTLFNYNEEKADPSIQKMIHPNIPILEIKQRNFTSSILKNMGIETIHSHHANVDCFFAKLPISGKRPKHIITMHGMYEIMTHSQLQNLLPLFNDRIDHFVYTAQKNISCIPPFYLLKKPFTKIGNALPIFQITPVNRTAIGIKKEDFVLCLVSRAIPEKGWLETINAVTIASQQTSQAIHLLIIGEGPELGRLKSMPHPQFIHFLGFQANIRDYFAMSDMGIIPSRFKGESFPLVLIDCLHAGRPVLASNIGEISDMLQTDKGPAGELFELENGEIPIKELSDIIVRLSKKDDYYKLLLKRVTQAAAKFCPLNMLQRYEEVYLNE